jgi:2-keto-4-pentenoate hydratase/2-oxohepta-3-ene-1,7-dioic acid hydratase in catechol pathway
MKIICIGRNYDEHVRELNNSLPENPVFFMKPDSAILRNNNPFFYPDFSSEVHHEVEVVFRICRLGRCIEERFAHRYYDAVTIGIDFTARDIQQKCKKEGLPWEIAKAFDGSAPLSPVFIEKERFKALNDINFRLNINEQVVQQGNTKNMLFSIDRIIAYVSQFVTLRTGDLIYTGTPSGVGPVKIGDRLQAYLEDELMLDFYVK